MNRVDEIQQRLAAATPGPWTLERPTRWSQVPPEPILRIWSDSAYRAVALIEETANLPSSTFTAPDAELIAHAPEDLAYLLSENVRLEQELSALRRAT